MTSLVRVMIQPFASVHNAQVEVCHCSVKRATSFIWQNICCCVSNIFKIIAFCHLPLCKLLKLSVLKIILLSFCSKQLILRANYTGEETWRVSGSYLQEICRQSSVMMELLPNNLMEISRKQGVNLVLLLNLTIIIPVQPEQCISALPSRPRTNCHSRSLSECLAFGVQKSVVQHK